MWGNVFLYFLNFGPSNDNSNKSFLVQFTWKLGNWTGLWKRPTYSLSTNIHVLLIFEKPQHSCKKLKVQWVLIIFFPGSKETSFVFAITAAAVAAEITTACKRNFIPECGCSPVNTRTNSIEKQKWVSIQQSLITLFLCWTKSKMLHYLQE